MFNRISRILGGVFVNNTVIVGVLAAALVVCIVGTTIIENKKSEYESAEAKVSQMEETETEVTMAKSTFFQENDINELANNYQKPDVFLGKTIIDVPVINQFPELPMGCEITSAAAILQYIGFDIDKVYLQENFLEDSYNFRNDPDGKRVGPDPNMVFVGDPKTTGFGCFSSVIEKTINNFFIANGSKNTAVKLDNADESVLIELLDKGIPIQVWASRDMKPFRYTQNNEWILETTGELFRWPGNAHSLVLIGYDEKYYYFSDCDDKTEVSFFRKEDFIKRWNQFDNQGVIIKISE